MEKLKKEEVCLVDSSCLELFDINIFDLITKQDYEGCEKIISQGSVDVVNEKNQTPLEVAISKLPAINEDSFNPNLDEGTNVKFFYMAYNQGALKKIILSLIKNSSEKTLQRRELKKLVAEKISSDYEIEIYGIISHFLIEYGFEKDPIPYENTLTEKETDKLHLMVQGYMNNNDVFADTNSFQKIIK